MARADLLKKLFSSFKQEDKDSFYKVASEIIEDERKKNHPEKNIRGVPGEVRPGEDNQKSQDSKI